MINLDYSGKKSEEKLNGIINYKRKNLPSILPKSKKGMLIHGDNFNGMISLLDNFEGKLDLIYIDPPFNTSGIFRYDENRVSTISSTGNSLVAYQDNLPINEYLEFIRERLLLIHKLLSDSGTLYFHIDIKVGHYIKIILDEIFGIDNYLNEITRVKSNPKNFSRKAYGNQTDTIYVYTKKKGKQIFNDVRTPLNQEDIERIFPKKDERGHYNTVPCHAPGETKNGATGQPWKGMLPPEGRHWRSSPKELDEMDKNGLIEWSSTGNPRIKKYASEHKGNKLQDLWLNYKDPQNPKYPTEKNNEMLNMIIKQSSNSDSIIMDSFSGSGSFLKEGIKEKRFVIGIDQSDVAIKVSKSRDELSGIDIFDLKNDLHSLNGYENITLDLPQSDSELK